MLWGTPHEGRHHYASQNPHIIPMLQAVLLYTFYQWGKNVKLAKLGFKLSLVTKFILLVTRRNRFFILISGSHFENIWVYANMVISKEVKRISYRLAIEIVVTATTIE